MISLAFFAGLFAVVKNDGKARLAGALFVLPLIPAMNASLFTPEQIVHDRYLYLPLLGILMLLVPLGSKFISGRTYLAICVAIAAVLAIQTIVYNPAWNNEVSVWAKARTIDSSSFTLGQYAGALSEAGRNDEAIREYSEAIGKQSRARSYLGRGRAYLQKGQFALAEKDLITMINMPDAQLDVYAIYQGYEALGIAYVEQKKFDQAIDLFATARTQLPIYSAALTEKMAIVLYQAGKKPEALIELESATSQARRELLPESKNIFFRLGMIYAENGRNVDARDAFNEYLRESASFKDKNTLANRVQAARMAGAVR
jgi:tetratricopeptide (TPR) repeat protein